MDKIAPRALGAIIDNFEIANRPLMSRTVKLLDRLCRDKHQHALFMNTLSMMEHIGSHKIMATQYGKQVDQPTLKHLAEETRHAFFFKRQAEKAAARELSYSETDLIAPSPARKYFQRLEVAIYRSLGADAHHAACYLYMSMIVEFRAVWGYRLYQTALQNAGHALSLKSLLAEEEGHLSDMSQRLEEIGVFSLTHIDNFCKHERRSFERLLYVLEADLLKAA